jgi:hypothetical protein
MITSINMQNGSHFSFPTASAIERLQLSQPALDEREVYEPNNT